MGAILKKICAFLTNLTTIILKFIWFKLTDPKNDRNRNHHLSPLFCKYTNIHWNLLGTCNLNRSTKHWEHEPAKFTTTGEIDIYYDKEVELGSFTENKANRPDMIIRNTRTKQVQIIEVSITSDTGITYTTQRKINKCTDFKNIMKREGQLDKIEFIPVILGVTGVYHKRRKRDIEKIWGNNINVDQLQTEVGIFAKNW